MKGADPTEYLEARDRLDSFKESLRADDRRREERRAERRKRTAERKAERARERGKAPGETLKRTGPLKSKGFTPASAEQKDKVARLGPRIADEEYLDPQPTDPAHIIARKQGGCDHEDCIIPLPRRLHRLYDEGKLDILPYLTLEEQAHAVSHMGILDALKRVTGDDYIPAGKRAA